MRPTGPGPLTVLGCVGFVLGYAIRPVSLWLGRPEPVLSLIVVVVLWLLALGVGAQALATWRALQRRHERMEPHRAVNRLLLGKASALAGALTLGGYAGFAVAHVGIVASDLAQQRLWYGVAASLGGLALMLAGLALERACRVRADDD